MSAIKDQELISKLDAMSQKPIEDTNLSSKLDALAASQGNKTVPIDRSGFLKGVGFKNVMPSDDSDLVKGAQAFNTGFERFTRGTMQPLARGRFAEQLRKDQEEAEALLAENKKSSPVAANIGEFAGSVAPTIPLMFIPGMGKSAITRAISQGALQGGLMGGAQYVNPGESRLQNAAVGAGLGVAAYPLVKGLTHTNPLVKAAVGSAIGGGIGYGIGGIPGSEIGGVTGAVAPFLPGAAIRGATNIVNKFMGKEATPGIFENMASRNVLKGINQTEAAPALEAAERLKLDYLTPAEATGSPVPGKIQGGLGRTEKGGELLFQKSQARLSSEKRAINTFLDEVSPETSAAREKAHYEKAFKTNPEVDTSRIIKHIGSALKEAKGDIKTSLQKAMEYITPNMGEGAPKLSELHQAKMAIDSLMEKRGESSIGKTAERELKKVQKMLLNDMDKASPEYGIGRELAQRRLYRKDVESVFDKREVTGKNFYDQNLKSEKRFDKLMKTAAKIPGAQQTLQDMRLAFKNLINPDTARTAAGLERTSMTKSRSTKQAVEDTIQNMLGGKYDKAAIELITNPQKWAKELTQIRKIKNEPNKAFRFSELLGKIAPTLGVDILNQPALEGEL